MLNTQEANKAVIATLGIKGLDSYIVQRVDKELRDVPSLENYIAYIEANENHADLTHKTGYQKFLILNRRYKKKLAELLAKNELGTASQRAKGLADKVKQVTQVYKQTEYRRNHLGHNIKPLHFDSFKNFFSEKDKTTLSRIGDLGECIKTQQSISGADALEEKLEILLETLALKSVSTQKELPKTDGQKRVKKMIGGIL